MSSLKYLYPLPSGDYILHNQLSPGGMDFTDPVEVTFPTNTQRSYDLNSNFIENSRRQVISVSEERVEIPGR